MARQRGKSAIQHNRRLDMPPEMTPGEPKSTKRPRGWDTAYAPGPEKVWTPGPQKVWDPSDSDSDSIVEEHSSLLELFEKKTYKEKVDIYTPTGNYDGDLSSDDSDDDSITNADDMSDYDDDLVVVPDGIDPVVYKDRRRWAVAADRDMLKRKHRCEERVKQYMSGRASQSINGLNICTRSATLRAMWDSEDAGGQVI